MLLALVGQVTFQRRQVRVCDGVGLLDCLGSKMGMCCPPLCDTLFKTALLNIYLSRLPSNV